VSPGKEVFPSNTKEKRDRSEKTPPPPTTEKKKGFLKEEREVDLALTTHRGEDVALLSSLRGEDKVQSRVYGGRASPRGWEEGTPPQKDFVGKSLFCSLFGF